MAYTFAYGGDPNNTNYRTSYSGNFLYTNWGGFPSGNGSSDGGAPVKIYSVGTDWSTGATYHAIVYAGVWTAGGTTFGSGGGGFQHRVGHDSGTLGAGRNTGNGGTMTDSADGDTVTGGICGWMTWATVSFAPAMVAATPGSTPGSITVTFTGNANNGGVGMDGWQLQYATNSGFSGATTIASSGTSNLVLANGTTYWFRSRGHNDVGWSAWSGAIAGTTRPAGGKRYTGSAFTDITAGRRWTGSSWVDLTTRKRWTGSAWVDITN